MPPASIEPFRPATFVDKDRKRVEVKQKNIILLKSGSTFDKSLEASIARNEGDNAFFRRTVVNGLDKKPLLKVEHFDEFS